MLTSQLQTQAPWLFHSMSFAFGLVFGSFTNVIVARLPHGQSVSKPASRCPNCETPILKRHNIPLLGYAMLKGKCRGCKAPISPRYPIIELLGGLLFLASELKYGWSPLLLIRDWPFLIILLAVTFIDLEHRIIPDKLSLGGLVLGLATSYFVPDLGLLWSVAGAAMGFGLFYALAWAYSRSSGKSGLGGGDIKLLAMMGAFLGPGGVFATILISSVLGSLIGLGWALAMKQKNVMGLAIPYGPFLVIGGLYYYFLGDILWLQFMTPT
jgi:leader peptidase (prepilin peptidase)/N-methyltransferase